MEYACCRTCGGYFPAGTGHGLLYCSRECAMRYTMQRLSGAREEQA